MPLVLRNVPDVREADKVLLKLDGRVIDLESVARISESRHSAPCVNRMV